MADFTSNDNAADGRSHFTFAVGEVVNNRWAITEQIGEGSFGTVYRAKSIETGVEVAMKASPIYIFLIKMFAFFSYGISFYLLEFYSKAERASHRQRSLEVDVVLLSKLNGSRHTCILYSYGTVDGMHYLVMELVGRTLTEIKQNAETKTFSWNTSVRIAIQCIEAVAEVHSIGYLHRDIKPDNLAIDVNEATARTIYLLDFGLARRYVTEDGKIRKARRRPGFRGTTLYSSVTANKGKEAGRVDDLWSVMYSVIECMQGTLPWDHVDDKDILSVKENMPYHLLLEKSPPEMIYILNYLKSMKYEEQPHYEWMIALLETIMQGHGFEYSDPYDWQIPLLGKTGPLQGGRKTRSACVRE